MFLSVIALSKTASSLIRKDDISGKFVLPDNVYLFTESFDRMRYRYTTD